MSVESFKSLTPGVKKVWGLVSDSQHFILFITIRPNHLECLSLEDFPAQSNVSL
jgi:hypothetical protein